MDPKIVKLIGDVLLIYWESSNGCGQDKWYLCHIQNERLATGRRDPQTSLALATSSSSSEGIHQPFVRDNLCSKSRICLEVFSCLCLYLRPKDSNYKITSVYVF